MTDTTYTIHDAENHAILATANAGNLQQVAANVAMILATRGDRKTRRAYVHNGRGVIAAGLCRGGAWHEILREDFMRCDTGARAARMEEGLQNDEPRDTPAQIEFAVEYRSMTGRIRTHRVLAKNIDGAIEQTVADLGIDFSDVQSTEERGA